MAPEQRGECRALVVGHVTIDRYAEGDVPGGGAWYGARTLAGLGAHVSLVTAVGEDFRPGTELHDLTVAMQTGRYSTTFANEYDAAGARTQWIDAVAPRLSPEMVDAGETDVLFLAPVFGELLPAEWSTSVPARVVGLGLQGLLREPAEAHPTIPGRRLVAPTAFDPARTSLAGIDVVFLSDEEVEASGGVRLLDRLRSAVGLVVVTRGERGSTIYARDRTLQVGIAEARVLDPTGAGDTYAAAFLFGLARGDSPEAAGRLAAAAASITVEGRGGEGLSRIREAFGRARGVTVERVCGRGS